MGLTIMSHLGLNKTPRYMVIDCKTRTHLGIFADPAEACIRICTINEERREKKLLKWQIKTLTKRLKKQNKLEKSGTRYQTSVMCYGSDCEDHCVSDAMKDGVLDHDGEPAGILFRFDTREEAEAKAAELNNQSKTDY